MAEQRATVADLKAQGRNARLAEQDLQLFEDSLAIFEDHLARASDVMIIRLTARAPLVRFP